jgi:hypothetical protein
VLALAGNAYQFIRQQSLEHDLDLSQRSTERQLAEVKEVSAPVQKFRIEYRNHLVGDAGGLQRNVQMDSEPS